MEEFLAMAIDFAGSLALVAVLAMAYAGLKRLVPNPDHAALILGATFGVVAILEMHRPIEMVPGVIIDLRNLPIALAGAFLGPRGLLIALALAVGARMNIGGVGWVSGVAGLTIAGAAGLLWATLFAHRPARSSVALLALVGMMSLHLAAAVLLPSDLAIAFLREAAPFLLVANVVGIFTAGALLQREVRVILRERTLAAAAMHDAETGLLTAEALDLELHARAADQRPHRGAAVMLVRVSNGDWMTQWGDAAVSTALAALRVRLQALVPQGTLLARVGAREIVVVMPDVSEFEAREIAATLKFEVPYRPIAIAGAAGVRVRTKIGMQWSPNGPDVDGALATIRRRLRAEAEATSCRARALVTGTNHAMFEYAERLRTGSG